jgi:hypothetical protein
MLVITCIAKLLLLLLAAAAACTTLLGSLWTAFAGFMLAFLHHMHCLTATAAAVIACRTLLGSRSR